MRRIVITWLICLYAAACAAQAPEPPGAPAMKTLVVYYSLTGKTEIVAQTLARELGADVRRVEDVEKPAVNWWFMVTAGFAALRGADAPIKPIATDLQGYDRVFVGSPVWAGSPSTPINAFIAMTDFSGKRVIPFMTMGGDDAAGALRKLSERLEKKGGKIAGSFAFSSGKATNEELTARTREQAQRYR